MRQVTVTGGRNNLCERSWGQVLIYRFPSIAAKSVVRTHPKIQISRPDSFSPTSVAIIRLLNCEDPNADQR